MKSQITEKDPPLPSAFIFLQIKQTKKQNKTKRLEQSLRWVYSHMPDKTHHLSGKNNATAMVCQSFQRPSLETTRSLSALGVSAIFFFFLFTATPSTHRSSWARGWIGVVARAYTTATAMPYLSHTRDLYHSLWQCWILSPLSEATDWICILTKTQSGP